MYETTRQLKGTTFIQSNMHPTLGPAKVAANRFSACSTMPPQCAFRYLKHGKKK